jgi:hypothetical protein
VRALKHLVETMCSPVPDVRSNSVRHVVSDEVRALAVDTLFEVSRRDDPTDAGRASFVYLLVGFNSISSASPKTDAAIAMALLHEDRSIGEHFIASLPESTRSAIEERIASTDRTESPESTPSPMPLIGAGRTVARPPTEVEPPGQSAHLLEDAVEIDPNSHVENQTDIGFG